MEKKIERTLLNQLKILSERSNHCDYEHGGDELARITSAMVEVCKILKESTAD